MSFEILPEYIEKVELLLSEESSLNTLIIEIEDTLLPEHAAIFFRSISD